MTSVLHATNPKVVASVFKKYDLDRTGKIDVHELGHILSDLGFNFDQQVRSYVLGTIDSDKSGFVTLAEFLEWWGQPDKCKFLAFYEHYPDWALYSVNTFEGYDHDRGKKLCLKEFQLLYHDFSTSPYDGLKFIVNKEGNKSAEQVYKKIDKDNTGVDLYEFLAWVHASLASK